MMLAKKNNQSRAHDTFFAKEGRSPFFQPKLTINQPNDQYEQEADAVADKVMRTPLNNNDTAFFRPATISPVQRKCAHCEEEEKKLQRKEKADKEEITTDGGLENYIGGLGSAGQPLPNETRSFFEPRFGHDLGNVKVHTDAAAARSAQSINALA